MSATKIPTMSVPVQDSRGPYVLGIDVGSTASRGGLYDATGRPVKGAKQRVAHAFTTTADGASTIDADQVVAEVREVIDDTVAFAAAHDLRIEAVCMDSFASSLLLVDAHGDALTPLYTYADSQSRDYVERLRNTIDEAEYHQRTGVRLHTSYHPARLAWAKEQLPEFARAATAMTIGEYVYHKLAGIHGVAVSTAAWSGVANAHTGGLDTEILDAIGIPHDMIQPLRFPDEPDYPDDTAWPALNGVAWFHCIPDGWPSNVGPGATGPDTIAVAAATSGAMRVILPEVPARIPEGLWCYRIARDKAILGGALNDVGRAVTWLEETIQPVAPDEIAAVLSAGPGRAPLVLPFFTGERSTGWAASAQAQLLGITAATTPADLWRGVFEGIALSYLRVYEQLKEAGALPERVVASGRVTADHPAWLSVLADALGCDVVPLEMKRATLRGTVLIALEDIAPEVKRATPPFGQGHRNVDAHAEYFRELRDRFEAAYRTLVAQ